MKKKLVALLWKQAEKNGLAERHRAAWIAKEMVKLGYSDITDRWVRELITELGLRN